MSRKRRKQKKRALRSKPATAPLPAQGSVSSTAPSAAEPSGKDENGLSRDPPPRLVPPSAPIGEEPSAPPSRPDPKDRSAEEETSARHSDPPESRNEPSPPPESAGSDSSKPAVPPKTALPPKVVHSRVVRVAGSPSRLGGRTSLPVLEAFQEFLEVERERARRRVVLTAVLFLALFIVLAMGLFFVGAVYYRRTENRLALLRRELEAERSRSELLKDRLARDVGELTDRAEFLQNRFERRIRNETERLLAGQTGLETRIHMAARDLQRLRSMLESLQATNDFLRVRLTRTTVALAGLSNLVVSLRKPVPSPVAEDAVPPSSFSQALGATNEDALAVLLPGVEDLPEPPYHPVASPPGPGAASTNASAKRNVSSRRIPDLAPPPDASRMATNTLILPLTLPGSSRTVPWLIPLP